MRKSNKKPAAATSNVPAPIAPEAKKPAIAAPAKRKPDETAAIAAHIARQALTDAARVTARKLYSGASLAVHAKRAPKLADAIARITQPIQIAANGASVRDESGLHVIASNLSDAKLRTFDPTRPELASDLGVLSRLASLGYIAHKPGAALPHVTDTGAERAKLIAKRA